MLTLTRIPLTSQSTQGSVDLLRNLTSFVYDQAAIALIIQPRTLSISDGRIYTVHSTQGHIFTP